MPRGAKLTPHVEDLIVKACIEHREWISKPKKIQEWVVANLYEQEKVWGGSNWPGIDVIKDRLREKIRPRLENIPPESKKLDEPWHVVTLADHDMPAEVLPSLLLIWAKSQQKPDDPLTIREAKWVARLYRLVNNIEFLYVYAKHYALEERVAEIKGNLPLFHTNVFFDAWWVQRPALESILPRWGRGLPDLEMIATSIFERPPKGVGEDWKEAVKLTIIENRAMMAEVVNAAGLPRAFLDMLSGALKKEAQNERVNKAKKQE